MSARAVNGWEPADVFLTLARHVLLRQLGATDPEALKAALLPAFAEMTEAWGQDPTIAKRSLAHAIASSLPGPQESPVAIMLDAGMTPPEQDVGPPPGADILQFGRGKG